MSQTSDAPPRPDLVEAAPALAAADEDPRAALADLVAQACAYAELDELLGVPCSPVPSLAPLRTPARPAPRRSAPAAAPPASRARERGPQPAPAGRGRERAPQSARPSPSPSPAPPAAARLASDDPEALAARRQANEARLHALADRLSGCARCRLSEGRTNLVFGQGDAAAELVFVGEGPGYHEDQQGLAFVGPSGELLTKMIGAMGLTRDEVFICNVVKCRPPQNRAPSPDEMGTCLPFLREQLEVIRPRVICALGRTAAVGLGLIGVNDSLGRSRGRFHDWHGTPAMVTYHPAYLLRNPAEKRNAWHDLQALFPYVRRRRPTPR